MKVTGALISLRNSLTRATATANIFVCEYLCVLQLVLKCIFSLLNLLHHCRL